MADILLLSPKKGEGLGVRELTISAITLEKWYNTGYIISIAKIK